jgi:MOSC domain-containing protein YiiM
MKLRSVNVSQPKTFELENITIVTGIFKEPIAGRVMLRESNLDGDGQADLKAHGGPFKAVYCYPFEHYAFWAEQLARDDFSPGQFGENFTLQGLTEETVCVGDQFRVGDALVQVTQPRVPCYKLAFKMDEPTFVKQFMQAERVGFYVRVLEEGQVGAGDTITRVKRDPREMSVRDIFHLLYFDNENYAAAEKALQIEALAPGWRGSFEEIAASK